MDSKGDTNACGWMAVAEIAARQHGAVTVAQLRSVGLSADQVKWASRSGRLHRVHRGVYAVGHPGLSLMERWMAAVLACTDGGRSAVLSHRSAAELWGMLPQTEGTIHVSVVGTGGKRPRRGLHVHRSRTLTPGVTTRRLGLPVTTPARTIADLRLAARTRGCPAAVSERWIRRAIRQAEVLGLPTGEEAVIQRTRSDLELAFLRLCHRHDLPRPEVNVRIGSLEVDFLWRDRRLVVETDGYRYHRGKAGFERDRERDLQLRGLGYEVIRISESQVADRPRQVGELLTRVLAEAG